MTCEHAYHRFYPRHPNLAVCHKCSTTFERSASGWEAIPEPEGPYDDHWGVIKGQFHNDIPTKWSWLFDDDTFEVRRYRPRRNYDRNTGLTGTHLVLGKGNLELTTAEVWSVWKCPWGSLKRMERKGWQGEETWKSSH